MARKAWDNENMKTISVNVKKELAEQYKALAEKEGGTVGGTLRGYIQERVAQAARTDTARPVEGVPHILTYQNTDRLKHEVAFHNPKGLNPDEMLNDILDRYFTLAKRLRV